MLPRQPGCFNGVEVVDACNETYTYVHHDTSAKRWLEDRRVCVCVCVCARADIYEPLCAVRCELVVFRMATAMTSRCSSIVPLQSVFMYACMYVGTPAVHIQKIRAVM